MTVVGSISAQKSNLAFYNYLCSPNARPYELLHRVLESWIAFDPC